jgi:hypothetical protein
MFFTFCITQEPLMQLTTLPIDDLMPAPYNPRVPLKPGDPGWEKLRRSIEEFDLVQPIVWNRRTGHVVGGHQRLEVLRHAGRTDIDCIVVDLPLEREQALNLALNNHAVGSDWDPGLLVALLEELQQIPDFDPTLTGFDEQQLADLVLLPDPDPPPQWGLDDDEPGDQIRVTLEVPPECWEETEAVLDELLAAEPQVKLHVKMPS